jgi:HAE1 family hydrophobic/amphiphilic exporter-1
VDGFSLVSGSMASNNAFFFVSLKEWAERGEGESAAEITRALNGKLAMQVPEAIAFAFGPPPIPGLGTGSGFTMMLQDRQGTTPQALQAEVQKFVAAAKQRPEVGSINTVFRATVPQVMAEVDREKAFKLGVPLGELNGTLGALLGSSYVNDFNRFGRVYKVFLRPSPLGRRASPGSYARSSGGGAARSLVNQPTSARLPLLFRAAELSGTSAPGYSSAQTLAALEEVAKETLGAGFGYDWSNVSFQEKRAVGAMLRRHLLL